jgi:hypothetical protein
MRLELQSRLILMVGLCATLGLLAGVWLLRPDRPSPPAELDGVVIDTRGPVGGARVRVRGQCPSQLSDARGGFQLPTSARKSERVTAWKEGYGIASASVNSQPLQLLLVPLPKIDNEDHEWIEPAPDPRQPNNCGNCHGEIHRDWSKSAHAGAAANRRFLSVLDGTDWQGRSTDDGWNLAREKPEGAGVCATCHAPTFTDPTLAYNFRQLRGVARAGVHCDYCHKIVDASTDQLPLRFGRDGLALLRPPKGEQLFFGPLDDAVREGETFGHAPLYKESRYCASCHEGVLFGVHVYSTYSEWLESPARRAGKECQTCHMASTGTLTNIAPGKGGIERDPWRLSSHRLPGAQAELLRRCLNVKATLANAANGVRARIEVRADDVGHRVPTGFIDRHLLLVVEAFDQNGKDMKLVAGATLSVLAGKELQGLPGWIYGKQLKEASKHGPVPFWLWVGRDDPLDTRLIPGQSDRREFVFANGVARLRVRLIYRRHWDVVARARGWPDNEILVVDRHVSAHRRE